MPPHRTPILLLAAFCCLFSAEVFSAGIPSWAKDRINAFEKRSDGSAYVDAVVLLDSQEVVFEDDGRVTQTVRFLRKHISQSSIRGTQAYLHYNPGYQKISSFKAWTYDPNKKRTSSRSKDDFVDQVVNYNGFYWDNRRLKRCRLEQTLVEGGYSLWEYTIVSQDRSPQAGMYFRNRYDTLELQFSVEARGALELVTHENRLAEGQVTARRSGPNTVFYGAKDVKGYQRVDLPQGASFEPTFVAVQVVPAEGNSAMDRFRSWPEFSRLVHREMEGKVETGTEITRLAAEITAGLDSKWEQVEAVCRYVQEKVYYCAITIDEDSLAGMRPFSASEVLERSYGDCKDKVVVARSLLKAIGVRSYGVVVCSGDPLSVREEVPGSGFNHIILAIESDSQTPPDWPRIQDEDTGELVLFDPTNPRVRLGHLAREDQGGFGLLITENGSGLHRLPFDDAELRGERRSVSMTLDTEGNLTGSCEETVSGYLAFEEISYLELKGREEFDKRINRIYSNSQGRLDSLSIRKAEVDETSSLILETDFAISSFAKKRGQALMYFSPYLHESMEVPDTAEEDGFRFVQFPRSLVQSTKVAIPEGFALDSLPKAVELESEFGVYRSYCETTEEGLVFHRELKVAGQTLDSDQFTAYRDFAKRVKRAESVVAVLVSQ